MRVVSDRITLSELTELAEARYRDLEWEIEHDPSRIPESGLGSSKLSIS
jgi:hypothetical protein